MTGKPGSSLVIDDTLNLVTNTTIEIDNLYLSGDPTSLTGSGNLTLLPATHGKDLVIGGDDGLAPDITLATLRGFGGGRELNIGVPAFPTSTSPFAGNVKVTAGLWVGDAVLTVGGLGDVMLNNHGDPLESDRAINIVAVGDRRVFPGLVSHDGGNILDSDASAGASATLKAPEVSLIAQGRVGSASNALEVAVGSGGHAGFVTGASEAFINTTPGGQSVTNISDTSTVLAAFQSQGFFLDPLSQAALGRTVGLETTGLQTTGLGELLYLDEGVFLLPDPYTTPVQATLLPALMDPDFPLQPAPGRSGRRGSVAEFLQWCSQGLRAVALPAAGRRQRLPACRGQRPHRGGMAVPGRLFSESPGPGARRHGDRRHHRRQRRLDQASEFAATSRRYPRCKPPAGVLIFLSDLFHDSPTATFVIRIKYISIRCRLGHGCDLQGRGRGTTIADDRI